MKQIHKRFSDEQVRTLFEKYERGEIEKRHIRKSWASYIEGTSIRLSTH